MNLRSAVDWLAFAALVVPLCALAWSAWQYVMIQRREEARARFDNFFRIMDKIGEGQTSIASKIAAVYELRKYPEYRDLIVRFCRDAAPRVLGDNAFMLSKEMELTALFYESGQG